MTNLETARAEAEKLLPCKFADGEILSCGQRHPGTHRGECPAFYREPVAQALAALMVERDRSEQRREQFEEEVDCANMYLDEIDCPSYDGALKYSLVGRIKYLRRALKRPDAPANTEIPGESICQTCKGTGQILYMWDRPGGAPGNGYGPCPACKQYATPEEIAAASRSANTT